MRACMQKWKKVVVMVMHAEMEEVVVMVNANAGHLCSLVSSAPTRAMLNREARVLTAGEGEGDGGWWMG